MNVYSVGDDASGILSGQVSRMPSALPQVPRYLVVHTVFWSSMHQWLSMKRSSQLAVPHEENSRSVVLTARSCSVHTLAFDLKCKQLAGKATPRPHTPVQTSALRAAAAQGSQFGRQNVPMPVP
jgi:hypothetical protein